MVAAICPTTKCSFQALVAAISQTTKAAVACIYSLHLKTQTFENNCNSMTGLTVCLFVCLLLWVSLNSPFTCRETEIEEERANVIKQNIPCHPNSTQLQKKRQKGTGIQPVLNRTYLCRWRRKGPQTRRAECKDRRGQFLIGRTKFGPDGKNSPHGGIS